MIKAQFLLLSTVLFMQVFVRTVTSGDGKTKENDHEEWRTLKKDESVPVGSHVRIDLTTGHRAINVASKKNLKFKTSLMPVETDNEPTDEGSGSDSKNEVKSEGLDDIRRRLKEIHGDDTKSANSETEKIKDKFKSYDEIKKDFEELQMAVRTDIEVMNRIIEKYLELTKTKSPLSEEDEEQQVVMLKSLEYLVHQIDNAYEFVKNDGLKTVVLPSLNSSEPRVRSTVARVLGSATQSNIGAQIAALEAGAVGALLRLIALDADLSVRTSCLFALSCLVRRFPLAQKKLVDEGGLTVLANFYNSEAVDKLNIRVKIITFIQDLIVEKQDAEKTLVSVSSGNTSTAIVDEAKERLRQYNLLGLQVKLQEQHWCHQLSTLLVQQVSQHLDKILATIKTHQVLSEVGQVDHDVVEKVLSALIASSSLCLNDLGNDTELRTVLQILYNYYTELARTDPGDDDYFATVIVPLIEDVSNNLNMKIHEHDEL
ncbi:nucleotide exchange factor SIL1 isoform X2 [Nilaparvata lugens]|uniref:nucleotide exchange factor SIL1 isoform X2 n=1 Tax=Nilaparvata lugens TaxID=108931 RepID=UPI000B97D0B8|nr:nucleotide exchange factor SIL1 isoform X2 [Nilaparvata lugens]